MSTNEHFSYQGPATIGGIDFSDVRFHEERDTVEFVEDGFIEYRDVCTRSWEGETSFPAGGALGSAALQLADGDAVTVRLPDGREGSLLVTNPQYDGQTWSFTLQGAGPAPH